MSNGDGLPKVPCSWAWTKIQDFAEVVRGGSPRPKGDPRYFGGTIPWIMISDVSREPGKYLSHTREAVTEEGANKSRLLRSGALILSNSGTVCVPKILLIDGCIHDGFVTFPNLPDAISKDYLYYWFHRIRARIIQENKQGITQVNLNTDIVRNMDVALAPAKEQRRIVAKIEELFSDLDAGVAALERVKAKLKRYRAAVLKAAVEGKLTEEWRKKNRPTETGQQLLDRILQERRQKWEEEQLAAYEKAGKKPPVGWKDKYKEPAAPDKSSLPGLPEGWRWASLGQLRSESLNGYGNRRGEVGEPTIVLRLADIENGLMSLDAPRRINSKTESIQRYSLRSDDLLVIRVNGSPDLVGRFVRIDSTPETVLFCDHFIRVRLFEALASRYVRLFADTAIARKHVESNKVCSAGQNTISQGSLDGLPIPLPPLKEQEVIVANVDQCLSNSGDVESQIAANLKRSARLRQSILKRAFEGKLVPQDPNDEPASVLLERIKMTKENGSPKTGKPARKTK